MTPEPTSAQRYDGQSGAAPSAAAGPVSMSRGECLRLLGSVSVGRISFSDRALPAVVPVTFALDADRLVVRTAEDSRIARVVPGTVVAFEVDDVEPALHCGWSVTVLGRAASVQDPDEAARLRSLVVPWAPGPRDHVITVPLTVVEGRRILPRPLGSRT